MSQYPQSPYSTPQPFQQGYSHDPYGAYLAPARRAGMLMLVLGVIGMACSLCIGALSAVGPMEKIIQDAGMSIPSEQEIGMSPITLVRIVYGVIASLTLILAIIFVILSLFVRRGLIGAIITSIVLDILILIVLLINVIPTLVQIVRSPATGLLSLAMLMAIGGAFGLLVVWLFQARRAGMQVAQMQQQYQQQYAQYQYYQQMYAQGYGYAQPPPQQQPNPNQNPSPPPQG